jgi:uncharacterized protein
MFKWATTIIFFIMLNGCQVTPSTFPDHLYLSSNPNTPKDASYEPTIAKINQLIKHKKWNQAENLLTQQFIQYKDQPVPNKYYQFKAQIAEQRRDILTALSSWIKFCTQEKENNCPPVWRLINRTPTHILTAITKQPSAKPILNWLELGLLIQKGDLAGITSWKKQHPNLPVWMNIQETTFKHKPKLISVILSSRAPMREENKAIKQGILSAYYHSPNTATLSFYNINPKHFKQSIQKALENNPDIIIGLTHPDEISNALSIIPKTTPIITLSTHQETRNNLFTLNLNQDDELKQLARYLQNKNLTKTIVLNYDDIKSQQLANKFTSMRTQSGGKFISIPELTQGEEPKIIRHLLNIDKSESRAHKIQTHLRNYKIKFLPTRRNDFDSIFLALSRKQARKIVPLLRYYFINSSEIFSTSHLLNGISNRFKNTDLNGIHVLSPTWMSDKLTLSPYNLKAYYQLAKLKSTHFQKYKIYYGLGMDAFNLSQQLPLMEQFPHSHIDGATGNLYLLNQGRVWRDLSLLVYKNGLTQLELIP